MRSRDEKTISKNAKNWRTYTAKFILCEKWCTFYFNINIALCYSFPFIINFRS